MAKKKPLDLNATLRRVGAMKSLNRAKPAELKECLDQLDAICKANIEVPTAAFEELGPDGRGLAVVGLSFLLNSLWNNHKAMEEIRRRS